MLPFILTAIGGYFIGSSLKGQSYADGGEIESAARRKADNPNWTNEKLLAEYNSLKIDLEDLKEGVITPRKVIGGGYKSSAVAKRIAKEWLENRIAEYKMALEIRGVMADGGDIAESNNRMLRSKVKEVKHHADELGRVVKPNTEIEGWVVAKAERSASDLSDITHYLDGQEFADGGQIDEATISNIRRNIMGTISFDMKLKGMRKPQDFIVYPITSDSAGDPIKVQSDTRIGLIDLPTGRGLMSQSHSSGAYNHHLQLDKKTKFTLSDSDRKMLTDKIKGTAGSSVGTRGITTDNSGASKLADGGKTKYGYVPRFDRHKEMDGDTRKQILDVISDLDDTRLENYLYGLFDGYDYSGSEKFKESMEDLKKKDKSLHDKVKEIYVKIDKYEKY